MKVSLHKPKNSVLSDCINYFYVLERTSNDKEVTYLGFPTYNVFATFIKNSNILIENENIEINHSEENNVNSVLFFDDQKSGFLKYQGQISEITICFKPLGINAFLENDFSSYKNGSITPFYPFSNFENHVETIFNQNDFDLKMQMLENYMLSQYKGFNHLFLKELITEILVEDITNISVTNLASKYKISRPTLNSHFKKHIGTNPNQFLKIVRFRNAIESFTSKSSNDNLVDIAFLTNYFDQSHMSKDFLSLTGYSPKVFFSKLTQLENGQINWLFL